MESHIELYQVADLSQLPKTGHDEDGVYSEDPEVYAATMARLKRKIEGAEISFPLQSCAKKRTSK